MRNQMVAKLEMKMIKFSISNSNLRKREGRIVVVDVVLRNTLEVVSQLTAELLKTLTKVLKLHQVLAF